MPPQSVAGSGPDGRIVSRDLPSVAPPSPLPVAVAPGAAYTDIELSNMRKVGGVYPGEAGVARGLVREQGIVKCAVID